jgi:hypothetical protein
VKGPPGVEEACLGCIFGVAGIARDQEGSAEGNVLVTPHEVLVGGGVAALGAPDQGEFVRRVLASRIVIVVRVQ